MVVKIPRWWRWWCESNATVGNGGVGGGGIGGRQINLDPGNGLPNTGGGGGGEDNQQVVLVQVQ